MSLTSPVHLTSHSRVPASAWENGLRLGCATLATLLAIGGAQLVTPNRLIVPVLVATLLGVPVSLYLRQSGMRIGSLQISRGAWNSLTVFIAFIASALSLYRPVTFLLSQFVEGMTTGQFLTNLGPDIAVTLLMQIFLIFAACRSFAQISDKDATLSTVPSFSILLLLIPLQRNVEVVFYFLAWMTVAVVLFALDHRSNLRERVTAHVPPPLPGQDVRLTARSLASILLISLGSAAAVSVFLVSRDVTDRSKTEEAIADLVSRLTKYALSIPDSSNSSGPERRIDFSSSPSVPTQAELWQITTRRAGGKSIFVPYWRMFTLTFYDGKSWSQSLDPPIRIARGLLNDEAFPRPPVFLSREERRYFGMNRFLGNSRGETNRSETNRSGVRGGQNPARPEVPLDFATRVAPLNRDLFFPRDLPPTAPRGGGDGSRRGGEVRGEPNGESQRARERNASPANPQGLDRMSPVEGFEVRSVAPGLPFQFGQQNVMVRQEVIPLMPMLGFLPALPAARAISVETNRRDNNLREISTRSDGGLNLGALHNRALIYVVSDVPQLPEYGFGRPNIPTAPASAAKILASRAQLPDTQRADALQLPPGLPRRVRDLGRSILKQVPRPENNLRLAQRLALAIQQEATYTLHPPPLPDDRDATDFFLFDGAKRGYCTHFAGALTVLCRSQGIPARVVSGFINNGEARRATTVLREANAHAWTEVWVEGWGWVVVDATPADDRGQNTANWIQNWHNWGLSRIEGLQYWATPRLNGLIATAIGLLMFLIWRRRIVPKLLHRLHRAPSEDERERRVIIETYTQVARQMTRKFRPRSVWETPDEWLQAISSRLTTPDSEALRRISALYAAALYAPKPLPGGSGALAKHTASAIVWKKMK